VADAYKVAKHLILHIRASGESFVGPYPQAMGAW